MNEVVVENRANVRWIKLNRPQVMNAITSEMLSSLNEELKKADEHKETRVIVLTGEGKGFCSGLDLKQAAAGEDRGAGKGEKEAGGGEEAPVGGPTKREAGEAAPQQGGRDRGAGGARAAG